MTTFEDLSQVLRQAVTDAHLADRIHRDPVFRAGLRDDRDATLRAFRVTTLAGGSQRPRELPRSWRMRIDMAKARPVL